MRHAIIPSSIIGLGFLGLGLLTGCPDRTISKVTPEQDGAFTKDIPLSADIDILFVIDDSASTSDKQTVFAQNFPKFVDALDNFPGVGRPNLHMGVVTSSVDIGVAGFGGGGTTGCQHPDSTHDGRLQNTIGAGVTTGTCPVPMGRYIVDVSQGAGMARLKNYPDPAGDGTGLAPTFSCIAQVGATGCGFEAQLNGMKRALDNSKPENAGFIRPGAFLAVVILTDEDDCSTKDGTDGTGLFNLPAAQAGPGDFRCQPEFAYKCDTTISPSTMPTTTYTNCTVRTDSYLEDPNSFAGFLGTIKDPNQIVVALIAGDPQYPAPAAPGSIQTGLLVQSGQSQDPALLPSCTATINGNMALGRPSIRLNEFLANFGDHGLFQTVCQSDYSAALTAIGNLLFKAVSPCLEGAINTADADPSNPGTQLDCTVSDVQNLDTPMQTSSQLTACKMLSEGMPDPASPTPCWYTKANPSCMTPTNLEIDFVRGSATPAIGTNTQVACATAPN